MNKANLLMVILLASNAALALAWLYMTRTVRILAESVLMLRRTVDYLMSVPGPCSFCGARVPIDFLEPEEAGAWVCHGCMDRWDAEDKRKAARLQ